MPIRPENKARYPADWQQIRMRILARAGNCCERCRVANHAWGYREGETFHRVSKPAIIEAVRSGREWVKPPIQWGPHKIIEIVLTIAHLNHVVKDCSDDNLQALCQRCHLAHDHVHHQQTAYRTRRVGRAAADLFEEL
jgi:hypothetical protein